MKIFENIVGQPQVIETLKNAVIAARENSELSQKMNHSWLFTGPPGSGKSTVAKVFAAALLCSNSGCGECVDCITAMDGSHLDIDILKSDTLSIKVDEIRDLISRTSTSPSISNWRVVIIQDTQRLTEAAANALLRVIEEPGARNVWILCVPSNVEVLPTIKSRCRQINFRTPSNHSVVQFIKENFGVDSAIAELVAHISDGNLNTAKFYAKNSNLITWRNTALCLLLEVQNISGAYSATSKILETLDSIVNMSVNSAGDTDMEKLIQISKKVKDNYEKDQKNFKTKSLKELLDQLLTDYLQIYTDVIKIKLIPHSKIMNAEWEKEIRDIHSNKATEEVLETISTILIAKKLLEKNISPQLIIEVLSSSTLNI